MRTCKVDGGLTEEVEHELSLIQEEIPQIPGEILIDACEDVEEVVFEGANGALGSIVSMYLGGRELIRHLTLLLDDLLAHADRVVWLQTTRQCIMLL